MSALIVALLAGIALVAFVAWPHVRYRGLVAECEESTARSVARILGVDRSAVVLRFRPRPLTWSTWDVFVRVNGRRHMRAEGLVSDMLAAAKKLATRRP